MAATAYSRPDSTSGADSDGFPTLDLLDTLVSNPLPSPKPNSTRERLRLTPNLPHRNLILRTQRRLLIKARPPPLLQVLAQTVAFRAHHGHFGAPRRVGHGHAVQVWAARGPDLLVAVVYCAGLGWG